MSHLLKPSTGATKTSKSNQSKKNNEITPTNHIKNCSICHSPLSLVGINDLSSKVENTITCNICLKKTCKNPNCITWLPKSDHWECAECHQFNSVVFVQAYNWIFAQLNQKFNANLPISPSETIETTNNSEQCSKLNGINFGLSAVN